jgi:hypothetical protein
MMTAHPCDEYCYQTVVRETLQRIYFDGKMQFIFFARNTFEGTSYFEEGTRKVPVALNEKSGMAILRPVV